jgi:hypothetical protein
MATVSNPALRRFRVRRAVTKVFPASVSVPVMKRFMGKRRMKAEN